MKLINTVHNTIRGFPTSDTHLEIFACFFTRCVYDFCIADVFYRVRPITYRASACCKISLKSTFHINHVRFTAEKMQLESRCVCPADVIRTFRSSLIFNDNRSERIVQQKRHRYFCIASFKFKSEVGIQQPVCIIYKPIFLLATTIIIPCNTN